MAMLSNWISKGAQAISNSAKSITHQNNMGVDSNLIIKQFLSKMELKLSKQLGQSVQGSFQSTKNDLLKESQMQKTLIQVKQRYNNLVTQSEYRTQCIKQMIHYFLEILTNISKTLQNEDLLTPLKDIQTAFNTCNKSKVEKQLKYFSKLYEAALQDFLKAKMGRLEQQKRDQVNLFKNLNKNLQVELFRSRNTAVQLQKRVAQIASKNQELNEKVSILEKLGSQTLVIASNKQKQRQMQREKQLLQKLKAVERQKAHLQRANKQYESQLIRVTAANQVIKNNQQRVIQQVSRQSSKKEASYQISIHKLCNQKSQLEERIKELNLNIQTLKEELGQTKRRQNIQKKDSNSVEYKNLNEQIKELSDQLKAAKNEMQSLVSKQIMKTLFVKFQDQSKEWSVRKDIKNQIYLLLDIKPKEVGKTEEKKWFGIF